MTGAALSRPANPPAVRCEFDLRLLPPSVDELAVVPEGFSIAVVAAVPARDRAATYRLESLWAMARGWIQEPWPFTSDLNLHLVDDYASTADGFTVLLTGAAGGVVGMHGAKRCGPGIGETLYLVVEPELRGRGLGRCLKAWQLTTARGLGWRVLKCDLPGDDAAHGVREMNLAMGGRLVTSSEESTG